MGNQSSKSKKKKKTGNSGSLFCCLCTLKKKSSSPSLAHEEQSLPTFDRLSSNEKPLPAFAITPKKTPSNIETVSSTSNNRRSLSLNNVILSLPDSSPPALAPPPVQAKPPLPPGKSITTSKLPPSTSRRSFRSTLAQKKRSFHSQSIEHARLSIEDLEKSLQGAASIDQWIDSLPILGTPSLSRNQTHIPLRTVASANVQQKIKRSYTVDHDYSDDRLNGSYREEIVETPIRNDLFNVFQLKCNREFVQLAKEIHLYLYVSDYVTRLKQSKSKRNFLQYFASSSSKLIYPLPGIDQIFADDLNLHFYTPSEYLLPDLSSNVNSHYTLHEQIRSKCYFVPSAHSQVELNDDEYQRKHQEMDRTHVVITLETKTHDDPSSRTKKAAIEFESPYLFQSTDGFRSGWIAVNAEKLNKSSSPFLYFSAEENRSYLSSTLLHQWFQTLILVNQTCANAQRFLKGDGSHISCLFKSQSSPAINSSQLTFAALRLPPCMSAGSDSPNEHEPSLSPEHVDAFSSTFLSDNKKTSADTIHIDYEQYAIAFPLHRWPQAFLEHYFHQSDRRHPRHWPSTYQMNIVRKRSLLLVPSPLEHQWTLNYDLIEQSLFELMNESSLGSYALCQQIFAQTLPTRLIVKHVFLNYCEKYGLPFSKSVEFVFGNFYRDFLSFSSSSSQREQNEGKLSDFLRRFANELHEQLKEKFVPDYFDHQSNLFSTVETCESWLDFIRQCVDEQIDFHSNQFFVSTATTNRPVIVEFLFHFIDQLYQTFHIKRSQFHLNENVLLDLHQQLCEKFTNDTNNNNSASLQKFIHQLLNNNEILEHIQLNLTENFESNAELVHTCLNQVRKADSSLIFHYTWTIYVQYLHTYYNVLWNI